MPPNPKRQASLEELKTLAEVRGMVAEEVDAKANLIQARALQKQTFWMKWMTIGTFLMALTTAALALLQYLRP
ncbi:MAG: hypothetical protein GOV15_03295 [Candidatus Diapherotrites archaeon]|nr:hypothetical protein [Candidatus Diapherotrites archaeon]